MHGTASAATSQNYPETIRATDQTTVHDASGRGSSSSSMGSEDHGRNMPTRKGSDVLLDRGGQGIGRRCTDEKTYERVERVGGTSLVDCAREA